MEFIAILILNLPPSIQMKRSIPRAGLELPKHRRKLGPCLRCMERGC